MILIRSMQDIGELRIINIGNAALQSIERQSKRKSWGIFILAIAILIAFFSRLPHYQVFEEFSRSPYGLAKLWWLEHPFQPVPVERFFPLSERHIGFNAGIASHLDKMTFRALLPLVHKVFPFGIWTIVAVSHLAGLAILIFSYQIVFSNTKDKISGALACWSLAGCYAGQYGFQDHYLGDSLAVSMLLAGMATKRPTAVALFTFAACLTDERSVFAAPLVITFYAIKNLGRSNAQCKNLNVLRSSLAEALSIVAGTLSYITMRWVIMLLTGAEAGTSMLFARDIIRSNIYEAYPDRVFKVFEFLWLILIVFLIEVSRKKGLLCWLFGLSLGLALFPAYMVVDIDRSMLYLLPAIITSICFLPVSRIARQALLLFIAAVNLAWLYPSLSALRLIANVTPG